MVSERLGHSMNAYTITIYQHVMPGMQADAAATFGAAVFGGQAQQLSQEPRASGAIRARPAPSSSYRFRSRALSRPVRATTLSVRMRP